MMLPDLNVLLYAVNKESARHGEAKTWLELALNEGEHILGLP